MEYLQRARTSVLRFFNASADEYEAIFTLNATGALRLVGEAYPFHPGAAHFEDGTINYLWIEQAHEHGSDVMLDAAAFVPTNRLDLSVAHPDYVALSFYKEAVLSRKREHLCAEHNLPPS